MYNGNHYELEPLNSLRHKRDVTEDDNGDNENNVHLLDRLNLPLGDFNGDELMPPGSYIRNSYHIYC